MPYVTLALNDNPLLATVKTIPPLFYEYYDQRASDSTLQGDGEMQDASTQAPVILLLHGAGGTYLSWPPLLRRMAGVEVYALDLPGHGSSAALMPQTGYEIEVATYAALVGEFITQRALQNVVLVGHSMGGAIALVCALQAAEQKKAEPVALGLVGTGATLPVNQRIFDGLEQDFAGITEKLVGWMYGPVITDKHRIRAVDELRKNGKLQLVADFQACRRYDVRATISQLALPTLIICGELDKMTPITFSQELKDALSASEMTVIPNGGHMVMLEYPQSVTERLQNFVNSLA